MTSQTPDESSRIVDAGTPNGFTRPTAVAAGFSMARRARARRYFADGTQIRNANMCACGHLSADHGPKDGEGIIEQELFLWDIPAPQWRLNYMRRGPIEYGCKHCGCQGLPALLNGTKPNRPVLCCDLAEDHIEGSGCLK